MNPVPNQDNISEATQAIETHVLSNQQSDVEELKRLVSILAIRWRRYCRSHHDYSVLEWLRRIRKNYGKPASYSDQVALTVLTELIAQAQREPNFR
jgi:hypothetical protein